MAGIEIAIADFKEKKDNKMLFILNQAIFECQCGWMLTDYLSTPTHHQYLSCDNPSCLNYGKKFKRPTIELEEY